MIAPLWWIWDGAQAASTFVGPAGRRYALNGPQLSYSLHGNELRQNLDGPQIAPFQLIGPENEDDFGQQNIQPFELQ